MLGALPLAKHALAAGWTPAAAPSAFQQLITEQSAAGQYLVEIRAFKGGTIRLGAGAPIGGAPLAKWSPGRSVPAGQEASGEVELTYADAHWVGAPSDAARPNTLYEGRVTVPLMIDRAMPLLPEQARRVQRQFGAIEIANADGALDPVMQGYAVDGRQVRVLFGPLMAPYCDFKVIASVVATGWEPGDLSARLMVEGMSYLLGQPLQGNLYLGSGGPEGTADLEGKPKPLCFGICRNVTPALIDPTNLIYQWHDGRGLAVDGVYDRGAALTASGIDVADYAALAATAVPAGHYATALAAGLFKLGSSPSGLVTADLRGDAEPDYAETIDVLALRILTRRAGVSPSVVIGSSFAGLAALAGVVGVYVGPGERPSTVEIVDRLVGSAGGWWGDGRDGRIAAGRLVPPETQAPVLYLDQFNTIEVVPEEAPPPRYRQRVAYRTNWTAQATDLAASVTAGRRQFLTESERVVTAYAGSVRVRHHQATDPPPLPTLLDEAADAQRLADHLLALFSPDRGIYRVRVKRLGYLLDLGRVIRLAWPRFGLSGGRNFAVIGIREDADRDETTLRIWG